MDSPASHNPITFDSKPRRWKDSWQVPLFILGFFLLALSAGYRIALKYSPAKKIEQSQDKALALVATGDFDAAISLARTLANQPGNSTEQANKAKLFLAQILIKQTEEKSQKSPGDYQEAESLIQSLSKEPLERGDLEKKEFLHAKIQIQSGKGLPQGLETLEKLPPDAIEPGEILPLIVQACLHLPKPNYSRALAANEEYRNIPRLSEEKRIPAQLLAGEILMQLQRTEEARKILEKIPETSPTRLVVKAKSLLAQTFMEDSLWQEAAGLWKKLLEFPGNSSESPGRILYQLGICMNNLESHSQAEKYWRSCEEKGDQPERVAASLRLARLYLEMKSRQQAAASLAQAVRGSKGLEDWKNPYFPLAETQKLFNEVFQSTKESHEYETALRLNDSMQKIIEPSRGLELRGDILADWGETKLEAAAALPEGAQAREQTSSALGLFREAANFNTQAASLANTPEESSKQSWIAASRYRKAKEPAKAQEALTGFLSKTPQDPKSSQAWYYLGEVQKELGNPDAKNSFQQAIKYRGPFAYRARYQLALIFMERNELDQAADALEQNLQLLRFDPDAEAQEKSLFALGSLSFLRKNYRMVARRYEEALERFPRNSQTVRARLQLAESYRQLANQEQQNIILSEKTTPETRSHYQKEHQKWLEKAAENYQDLELVSATPLGISQLTPEERALIPLLSAECQFNLGKYEEALGTYARQAARLKGKQEGLHALGGLIRCHSALGQADLVQQRLADLKELLASMDDSVRKDWEPWIAIAGKPLAKP
ncbi:MAG: tetratricopeptide repeat protein [Gemmataceae bacterium]|nr:tetratricopeptide repeat protein [Gemmataceae bacterium]